MTLKDDKENAEREYVVKPIKMWLEKQKAKWDVYIPPTPNEIGWDLEARRPNMDILVEAKYITSSFIGSFSSLVTSPLTKRSQHFMKTKDKSWCYHVCWAIGTNRDIEQIYQNIFDYIIRNLDFWKHYSEDLKVYYVYFVSDKKVTRILFKKLLEIAENYKSKATGHKQDRVIAKRLMS